MGILAEQEIKLFERGIESPAEHDEGTLVLYIWGWVVDSIKIMPVVGDLNPLISDGECIEPGIKGLNVSGRGDGAPGILRRQEEFRRAIVGVGAQQRAALGDPVCCGACEPDGTITCI